MINFNQKILTLDGKVVHEGDRKLTLLLISQNALLNVSKDDEHITSGEKVDRYALALKITMTKESEIDVTAENIVLLKKVIGKLYVPLIVGQVFLMLEGKPTGITEVIDEEVMEN
jgi:hypothetical protein